MKWTVCCAIVCLGLSAEAAVSRNLPTAQISESNSPRQKKEAPCDQDLFRKNEQVFSLHGEFLFWWVEEGALDYALKMTQPAWSATDNFAQGKFERAKFSGEPGFRIKASYFRAPHYWEIWGQYTRLTGRGKDHASDPVAADEFLTGTWPQIITAPLTTATSRIHMNYNVADLLVDRYFVPNPHLRLRLLGGATVVWMNQNWVFQYNNAINEFTKVRSYWKYVGGGLRVGTTIDWFFGYDIYLTGLATTGLTLGSYQNKAKQTTNRSGEGDNPALPVRDTHYSDIRPAFTVQVQAGPSWQKSFTSTRVEVFAGYELNTWLNLQEVYRSTSGAANAAKETWINTSAIALQGLTTRLTVDF